MGDSELNDARMYNSLTYQQAMTAGMTLDTLRTARRCCLERIARGVYIVAYDCPAPEHNVLRSFIDDLALLEPLPPSRDRGSTGSHNTDAPTPQGGHSRRRADALARPEVRNRGRSHERERHRQTNRHLARLLHYPHSSDPPTTVSHRSAALSLGIPLAGPVPRRLELSRSGKRRATKLLVLRDRVVPPEFTVSDSSRLPGIAVTTAAWTVLDLVRDYDDMTGMVAVDAFLTSMNERGTQMLQPLRRTAAPPLDFIEQRRFELMETFDRYRATLASGRGDAKISSLVQDATGLAESVFESMTAAAFRRLGLEFAQQVELHAAGGEFVARVDFVVQGVVVEADGWGKYFDAEQTDGGDAVAAFKAEKRREDRIRALGYRVVRIEWRDLHQPERLRAKLQEAGIRC